MGVEYVIAILMASIATMCTAYLVASNGAPTTVAHSSTDDPLTPNEFHFLIYDETDCAFEDDKRSCCPFRKQLTSWEWIIPAADHERKE